MRTSFFSPFVFPKSKCFTLVRFTALHTAARRATERRSVHNLKLLTVGCLLFPGDLDSCRLQHSASARVQLVQFVVRLVSVGVTRFHGCFRWLLVLSQWEITPEKIVDDHFYNFCLVRKTRQCLRTLLPVRKGHYKLIQYFFPCKIMWQCVY